MGLGCVKTPKSNLPIEFLTRLCQFGKQKRWRSLSRRVNKENNSARSSRSHVFTQPGSIATRSLRTDCSSHVRNAPLATAGPKKWPVINGPSLQNSLHTEIRFLSGRPRRSAPSESKTAAQSTPVLNFIILPLPRDISAKCGGCRSRKAIQNQSLTKSVLNPRSREVWRQTGREREFRVSAGVVAVRRFSREARGYWASMRARNPAENVGRGRTGGGRGIRTVGAVLVAGRTTVLSYENAIYMQPVQRGSLLANV